MEPKKDPSTRHLLAAKGNHTFDQSVGRARFFGPTANSHVYAKVATVLEPQDRVEKLRRAEGVIRALRPPTYDHLMRCFWDFYNPWLQVVDESGFEAGRSTQDSRFYSTFLHLAMLAIGFRFADRERDDMQRLMAGARESTFHRETKALVQMELERPGGIPSVQALLLLADLECGVGRDATGWMYAGRRSLTQSWRDVS